VSTNSLAWSLATSSIAFSGQQYQQVHYQTPQKLHAGLEKVQLLP